MTIKTLGIDLGKNSFHLHGMDEKGKTVLQKKNKARAFSELYGQYSRVLSGDELVVVLIIGLASLKS